jgi:hypothetical protein
MNSISRYLRYIAVAAVAAAIGISASNVFGQDESRENTKERSFCSSDNWSGDKVSYRDLREMTLTSTGSLNVDSGQNGGISVKGEERSDVLVRACVQTMGATEAEAKSLASAIRVETSPAVKAVSSAGDNHWSVSYQILVPRATNLQLAAHNGGISISGVDGAADFETMNGGVRLTNLSGDVKGRTTNGGVNIVLSGTSWRGSGLDVRTTNGGVRILMPLNYSAHVETSTVNGGVSSDIPGLNVDREDIAGSRVHGSRAVRISTDINGGGAPIRVVTTNGGVKIGTTEKRVTP